MKICSLKSECFGTFCEGFKSGNSSVFKCPIPQGSKNKGAFQVMGITADAQNVDYHHYHPQDLTTLQKLSHITNGREASKINHSDLS